MIEFSRKIKIEKAKKYIQLKNEINLLFQIDMINYFNYMNEKKLEQEKMEIDVDDESTIDKSINKILEL